MEVKVKEARISTTPGSMAVNKIDLKKHLKEALPPEDTVKEINKYLDGFENVLSDDEGKVVPIGHNIYFDVDFLKRLFKQAGIPYMNYFSHRTIDTATLIRFFNLTGKLELDSASLASACKYLGIKNTRKHNAFSDAVATAKVLQELLKF